MITNNPTVTTFGQKVSALIAKKIIKTMLTAIVATARKKRLLLVTPLKALTPPHINNAANIISTSPTTMLLTCAADTNEVIAPNNAIAANTNAITAADVTVHGRLVAR